MENQSLLQCEKCGSSNVQVQLLNQIDLKVKRKGIIWWTLIGWWFITIKWLFFFWLALIIKILKPKKYKTINRVEKHFVCNNCGHSWQ